MFSMLRNEFTIVDNNGSVVSANTLDEVASKFWGVVLQEDAYARPKGSSYGSDWFFIIGGAIANQGNFSSGWANIVHTLFEQVAPSVVEYNEDKKAVVEVLSFEKLSSLTKDVLTFMEPYVALMNEMNRLGYQPKKTN